MSILSSNGSGDAFIRGPGWGEHFHYVQGFQEAIEAILKQWDSSGRHALYADSLVFPLGLLCRHLIELQLKRLGRALDAEGALDAYFNDPKQSYTHALQQIWRELRPRIESRWPGSNMSTIEKYGHLSDTTIADLGIQLINEGKLDRLERLVSAFHDVDPNGLSFRYPGSMPNHVSHLALDRMAELAIEISSELDGLMTGLYEELTSAAEMHAEWEPLESDWE